MLCRTLLRRPLLSFICHNSTRRERSKRNPCIVVTNKITCYIILDNPSLLASTNARNSRQITFDDIPSAKDFITEWYNSLNGLELTDEQKQEIVDEANRVFDLNIGILQELEGSAAKAMLTLLINSLKSKLGFA